ncbi:MAG: hypothetical protein HYX40_07300 [Sphingobacteriales bacterium]|nr:hypothetical protein [Sphingobacteriales bacterium]
MKTISLTTKSIAAILLGGTLFFAACKKESSVSNSQAESAATVEASQNDAEAEGEFNDVYDNVVSINAGESLGLVDGAGIFGREDSVGRCFTVTVSPATPGVFPKTVTIDFGTACTGKDGKTRSGKIISVFTGHLAEAGNSVTTTFDNYMVDSFKIEGTHKIINTSTSNNRSFNIIVSGAKITKPNGKWYTWDSNKVVVQVEGNGTPRWPFDDIFEITGSKSGSNSAGKTWSATVIDKLIRKGDCRWIVQGTVSLSRNGNSAILNYGSGTCDNKATITANGQTIEITLR